MNRPVSAATGGGWQQMDNRGDVIARAQALARNPGSLSGMIAGAGALLLAGAVGRHYTGLDLANPLPLAIAPGALLRSMTGGFRYFDWQSPLLHLLFAIALGAAAAFIGRGMRGRPPREGEAIWSARVASAISLLATALGEVDAPILLVYFSISAFISLTVSAYTAARLARAWALKEA